MSDTCDVGLNEYVGLKLDMAEERVKQNGMIFRIMCRDGECFVGTCDWRTDRVNFHVTNGVVTRAYVG